MTEAPHLDLTDFEDFDDFQDLMQDYSDSLWVSCCNYCLLEKLFHRFGFR